MQFWSLTQGFISTGLINNKFSNEFREITNESSQPEIPDRFKENVSSIDQPDDSSINIPKITETHDNFTLINFDDPKYLCV